MFDHAIANVAQLDEHWGIKDINSKHIYMNTKAWIYTKTPSHFVIEKKGDEEFPAYWSALADDFILHDKNTIQLNKSVSVIEVHYWNGCDTFTPFISTKFPIYSLDGCCLGVAWNAKPVEAINPFIESILKKSVITLF